MKTLLKSTLAIATLALLATSCTSRKQHCDAYGSIATVENAKKVDFNSTAVLVVEEIKS
ncbi:MAG: hypothetical protein ABF242_07240 [Flavobacteriales bacterium]